MSTVCLYAASNRRAAGCGEIRYGRLPISPCQRIAHRQISERTGSSQGFQTRGETRTSDRYLNAANLEIVERLEHFAEERGRTLLELAFSWLLARPAVASVIAGAAKPEQVEKNAVSADWNLSSEELAEIDRITGKCSKDSLVTASLEPFGRWRRS